MTATHAVILAGGRGTRLRPFTTTIPKPLVPIGDDGAIIEIVLRQLVQQGFDRVTLAIGHQGDIIRAYVGSGDRWGLTVEFVTEEEPLGTMGPVVQIRDRLPAHFLVLNGDILTDLPFRNLLDQHVAAEAPLTIATYRREVQVDYGVLEERGGRVIGFKEKPTLHYAVSMGAYAVARETLAGYPLGRPLGFDQLVLDLIAAGRSPAAYPYDGYWLDIGRPEDYDRANLEFASARSRLLPPAM